MLASPSNQQKQTIPLFLFLGFIICAAATLLFSLLAKNIIGNTELVSIDQNVATALHSWATPNVTELFKTISLLGLQILWVIVIVVAIIFALHKKWESLLIWVAAFVGAELLDQILKGIFNRPRPTFIDPLLTAANASFPSGHAMVSLVVYGMLAFFLLLQFKNPAARIAIIVPVILLVILIGISRIYLGVHYFSDVAAGYTCGVIWLTICINMMNYRVARREWRRARKSTSAQ